MLSEHSLDRVHQPRVCQLHGREIDRDAEIAWDNARALPNAKLSESLIEDPRPKGNDQAGFFRKWDECIGRNEAMIGALPPDESFDTVKRPVSNAVYRLIEENELLPDKTPLKRLLHVKQPRRFPAVTDLKPRHLVSALALGPWPGAWQPQLLSEGPPAHGSHRRQRYRRTQ